VVVMKGLEEGQKVITDGFQRLRDGGKITLVPPPAAPGAGGAGPQGGGAGSGKGGAEKSKQQ